MRLPALAACCLTILSGLALAQEPTLPASATAPAAPGAAAPVPGQPTLPPPAEPAFGVQERSATLKQLGMDYEVTLRGIQGSAGVSFSARTDEVVEAATLHLRYSYSPALLPDLSHLKITVNGVTVATLPVSRENAGKLQQAEVPIDPRLVSDYNQLNLQLIGHYTRECEDPDHTSLWANIDPATRLSLSTTPLVLANDLALLPVPFYDKRDTRRLELPFVFQQRPDLATLRSAGIVSSWFGAQAGYRGALFTASIGELPATGNAVLFATANTLPAELVAAENGLGEIAGPTLAVVTNPRDPAGKLLLVLGRNDVDLQQAATALALGTPLNGAVARIGELKQPQPRKPYDAPNWISSDGPVRFADLVAQTSQLNVSGYHPDLIRVGLQLPPDLFVWQRDGIPVNLRYRYTVPDVRNKSALNVSINDAFVTTLPLSGRPYAESLPLQWWHDLKAKGAMPVEQKLLLPTGPFSANSQLRFHFFFDRPQAGECKNTFPDVSGAIDADSSVDLSSFHHYMAMPNLAAFGNAGYPFTRLADLSESTIVVPDEASDQDMSTLLTLLGKLGASTGYPALRATLIHAGEVEQHADSDLLVFGSSRSQPLFQRWSEHLPISESAAGRRFAMSDWVLDKLPGFLSFDARRTDLPTTAEVAVKPAPGDVVLMGFESPLKPGRSVVALLAEDPASVGALFDAWFEPATLKDFQGSVVLLQQGKIRSLAGNQTYYVGHLPLPTWARWYFSQHPLLLGLAVVVLSLLLALAARVVLRRHSAQRLREGQ
ncbi:cellulose biosynthesis cyclic di-GMP-binding regulatory protein BcsB [Xanthomonas medicagonis]|uniref:cellulose biosynthesis cyclic di-GMP-binding regulatory protein BcsB n=1 Tax=Xanthomonas medicagonis TaxID=3160841 RepID=UPI003513DF3A